MSLYFKDKVVIVTGGTGGIGKALVEELLQAGAKVATCGRDHDKLYLLQSTYPSSPLYTMLADVSSENDCRRFIETTIKVFGGIDILINNAGIGGYAPIADVSEDMFDELLNIHFKGVYFLTQKMLSLLRNDEQLKQLISNITALGRPGVAEDIGGVVAFLCTEEARWVNGQRIEASGGMQL